MAKPAITHNRNNDRLNRLNGFLASYFSLVTTVAVFVTLILGLLVLLLPKYYQIEKRVTQTKEQRNQEYDKLSVYFKKLQTINSNYRKLNPETAEKIKKLLPSKPEIENLIESMEFMAKNNGLFLTVLDIDPGEETTADAPVLSSQGDTLPAGVGMIKITLNLAGVNYEGLKNYIVVLEKSLRLMDVTKLMFSPSDESLVLEIDTYYLK